MGEKVERAKDKSKRNKGSIRSDGEIHGLMILTTSTDAKVIVTHYLLAD
jgi:hypothetical protein